MMQKQGNIDCSNKNCQTCKDSAKRGCHDTQCDYQKGRQVPSLTIDGTYHASLNTHHAEMSDGSRRVESRVVRRGRARTRTFRRLADVNDVWRHGIGGMASAACPWRSMLA
jgi:hypothetical protein